MALSPEDYDKAQASKKCAICGADYGSIAFFNKGKAYHIGCIFASYQDLLANLEYAAFMLADFRPEALKDLGLDVALEKMEQAIKEARA